MQVWNTIILRKSTPYRSHVKYFESIYQTDWISEKWQLWDRVVGTEYAPVGHIGAMCDCISHIRIFWAAYCFYKIYNYLIFSSDINISVLYICRMLQVMSCRRTPNEKDFWQDILKKKTYWNVMLYFQLEIQPEKENDLISIVKRIDVLTAHM